VVKGKEAAPSTVLNIDADPDRLERPWAHRANHTAGDAALLKNCTSAAPASGDGADQPEVRRR
jgi:hypothetical protein